MVVHDLLGQGLVVGQHQAARVATGVTPFHQLQIADHVLIVDGDAVELLQQIEGDPGFERIERVAQDAEIGGHAKRLHVMTHLGQRGGHIVLVLERDDLLLGETLDRLGRNQILVHQYENARRARGFLPCARACLGHHSGIT